MRADIQAFFPADTQVVAFTGTAANSSALSAGIRLVRLVATQDCHIAIGDNPTATTSDMFLPANVVDYIMVSETDDISVIQNSTGGNLYITEMTK